MLQEITRSPGVAVGPGFVVGGGQCGSTPQLDCLAVDAAEALRAAFSLPAVIRFNSDRMSGGAWLHTHPVDGIGRNTDIGIRVHLWEAQAPHPRGWARDTFDDVTYPIGTRLLMIGYGVSLRCLKDKSLAGEYGMHWGEAESIEGAIAWLAANTVAPEAEKPTAAPATNRRNRRK